MTQNLTTPGIDRPWLKYYSEEIIHARLPEMTMYQYIWEKNRDYLSDAAFRYYGTIKKAGGFYGSMAGNQTAPGAFCVSGGSGV